MIVGVGGQGTLLSSRLLGAAMMNMGLDIKVSEVHGMSQRGGSVVTYVRCGERVASPMIEKGEADIILAFEQLEAARWLPYLKKGGKLIVNTQQMDPMPVVIGTATYPQGLLEQIKSLGVDMLAVDALKMATDAGSSKAVNVALIGLMAQFTDIPLDVWKTAIEQTVPQKFMDVNEKAFALGYNYKD